MKIKVADWFKTTTTTTTTEKQTKPLLPWLVYKPVDYFVGPGNLLISAVDRVYKLI
jgi:hypothetical protein